MKLSLYKDFSPAVSIILPTFNREKLLKRAVNSVLNQSFKNWELIIVDDGSSDGTFSVINEFQKDHENIRYIKHPNKKLPLSLNTGIQASCGEFITFLGSDDEYKPEHLELRYNYMNENPNIDLLHGGIEVIGDPFVKDKNDLSKKIHLEECHIGGTFFCRRKIFEVLGGFKNIEYSEDSEFFERVEAKFKTAKVNFPTYVYYRDTPDSICNSV